MRNEVKRRLVHVSGAGLPGVYLLGRRVDVDLWEVVSPWELVQLLAVAGASTALVLEVVRLLVGLDWRVYDDLTREYEQDNLAGYALYMVGMATVALAFEPPVAVSAMLMLAVGDPVSGLLGSDELRDTKRSHVLLAMFAVCLAVSAPFVAFLPAVLGALVATLADGVKPVVAGYVIDDNITIPIGGAVAIHLGLEYLHPLL